ncbi:MAG: dihydroorotase [candidate division WOR-3 bacterium]
MNSKVFHRLVIRGGKIIIPGKKIIDNPDIYIADGKILAIERQPENIKNAEIIQLDQNCYISPGFVDLHCHLREPGNTDSETIETGSLSAIAGGFAYICCMPNTKPPIDNAKIVADIKSQAKKANNANVLVISCATKKRQGKALVNINEMLRAGVVAFSDDGSPIVDSKLMTEILQKSKKYNFLVINHCEVLTLSHNGVLNEGKISKKLNLKGIPDIAESIMVLRDVLLADKTQGKLHIAHVSTKKSVEIIRWAKKQGINVTAETCPHYFTLTEDDCLSLNTNYKVSPPLRTKKDVEAIKEGLADGTIDAIATDHAPWHKSKKQVKWEKAKSGMIGFETAFSLGYQELVLKKYLTLEKYIACLTTRPAEILNLKDTGKIAQGIPAAITIFDLSKDWTFNIENIVSKSKNSPFIGRKLKGKVELVILTNKIFYIS